MWDGSAVPLAENLQIAAELLAECAAAHIIMEMEIGVVGGEEDGVVGEINEKLYTTPEDALATAEALGLGERGRYMLAATFGNVHGVYKPGHVKLRPSRAEGDPGGRGPEVRPGKALRPGLPRRVGFGAGGDQGGHLLRRGQDERRHRHPVRVHQAGRGPHVQELRRRAQGGRRGRQQEGVRPAQLGQGGRGGHGGAGHARLRGPDVDRPPASAGPGTGHGTPEPARRTAATYLPPDEEAAAALQAGEAPEKVAARFPSYSAAWAALADARVRRGRPGHRLRVRADGLPPRPGPAAPGGLEGHGPIPWEHEPNRGFLRSLHMLARRGRGHRRGRRGRALRAVPAGQQPHRRR